MTSTRPSARAADGASTPAKPCRQACSPIGCVRDHCRRLGERLRNPRLASSPGAARSATLPRSTSKRHRSRGMRFCGGTPNSDVWRNHSAQAVSAESARYRARTIFPRSQRPSAASSIQRRGSPPGWLIRHHVPLMAVDGKSNLSLDDGLRRRSRPLARRPARKRIGSDRH